jgi:phenylacetate-CoA ligase
MTVVGDFGKLQAATRRAWQRSRFYREHWLKHGLSYGWVPQHPDELEALPVVTKQDLLAAQASNPPWGGNLCVDEVDVAQVHLTTGTSGIGQERYACTASDVHVMGASWGKQYEAIGLKKGDVGLFTIPVAFFCAGLSALEGARIHGLLPILTGVASKNLMLELITQHRVNYIYGTESLLLQLANLAREEGLAGRWRGQIKGIQSVGTSPQLLELADEVFQAKVFEVYGCTQAAAKIANTCRLGVSGGTNHFHPEHLYVEARHPETGRYVESGEAELIISTPFRQACPVIRFAIRDKVELVPSGECPCGDLRPGFRPGSLSRIDSMLKIRGVNVWPQQIEQIVLGHPGVNDFRAEVRRTSDGADELLLRVVCAASAEPGQIAEALTAKVREQTMVRPNVVIQSSVEDSLGAYKVKRFTDLRRSTTAPSEPGALA